MYYVVHLESFTLRRSRRSMLLRKLVFVLVAILLVTGCSCRKKAAGSNIPLAEPGSILKDVHFAFDSYALDSSARAVLDANADWLKANSDRRVQVEGHCDERGTNEYNMALGQKRAQAAFNYLKSAGVHGDSMSTVSYGEDLPLDPSHTEEAYAKNRRAHINLQ